MDSLLRAWLVKNSHFHRTDRTHRENHQKGCVSITHSHISSFLQPPFESTRVKTTLAWHVPIAVLGLLWKNIHSPHASLQPPSWWPTELAGFTALIFSRFKHTYTTAKQLKAKKCFFWYHFSIWAVATREPLWHKWEQMGQSIYYHLCHHHRKWATLCPGEGIQWFGSTKMVKWILTPNLIINT